MCLLLLAWKVHPRYELLLAANRDEHHARPTAPLDFWPDTPGDILAGRDLVAAGTWLAARADGRFAAVTNFRDESASTGLRSRGELVMRYFDSGAGAGCIRRAAGRGSIRLRRLQPDRRRQ